MNAVKISTCIIGCLLLASCASTTPQKAPMQYLDISNPEINKEASATLGEKLLMQATGYYAESITIEALDAYSADIPNTTTFYRVGNGNYFESDNPDTVVLNNGYGNPLSRQKFIEYNPGENKFCVGLLNCFNDKESSFKYNPEKTLRIKPNSFQQVIEYNGKSGETLKFTYREFSGDLARSAFTTDFNMDLREGKQIGYKGAVIEVIEASNNVIKYRVIKNFNK